MIDVSKCCFEECFTDEECTVFYFTYPKDMKETEFYSEEDYGNVVGMCISLSVYQFGDYCMAMSPTILEGDSLIDVDWRDLFEGENYLPEFIPALLEKAYE